MVALTLLGAACTGGPGPTTELVIGSTREAMAAAADRTLDGGDFRMEFTMMFSDARRQLGAHGAGEYDADAQRLHLTMAVAPDGAADEAAEVVVATPDVYLKADALGDRWVRIDLEAVGLARLVGPAAAIDPSRLVALLKGARDIEEVGREDVRGTATTHFAGSYTVRDALSAMTAEQRTALDQLRDGMADAVLDTEVPFDAWIDGDGRVRRVDMTLDASAAGRKRATTGSIDASLEFFDFGTDVTVDVPAVGDAIEPGDLLSSSS